MVLVSYFLLFYNGLKLASEAQLTLQALSSVTIMASQTQVFPIGVLILAIFFEFL